MSIPKLPALPFLARLRPVWRYRVVLFVVFITALSGYLVLQISNAINVEPAQPTQMAIKRSTPRIDQNLVRQLQSLQDNSVSVKALFNQARDNPFQ